ncbi:hypothetical protein ZWY2020_002586 [Hordeum vulgare]|nr:hypothetical protein ZWY2020_002586 [Hordeum vulgare]
MDGDDELPFDFFSQTASSGAAVHHIDEDGWGMTSPRLRGSAGRGLVAGGLGRGSVAGGLRSPIGLENIDLNADSAVAASYPNMGMYTQLFHQGSAAGHVCPSSGPDRTVWRSGRQHRSW